MFKNKKQINSLGLQCCLLRCVLVIDRSLGSLVKLSSVIFILSYLCQVQGRLCVCLSMGFFLMKGCFLCGVVSFERFLY